MFNAVMPFIYPPYKDACLATMSPHLRERTILVDNTQQNRGVPASWNIGVRAMLEQGLEWCIILSAAMRFGAPGGEDFLDALAANPEANAIEATKYPGGHLVWNLPPNMPDIGWHCIAFSRKCVERVGLFDENFWPIYWEDCDYGRRMSLALDLRVDHTLKVGIDADCESVSHGVVLGGVDDPDRGGCQRYYEEKWGGPKMSETFTTPFGVPDASLSWWPEPPDARARKHGGWGFR